VIFLARQIWWAWPLVAFARLPGMHELLDRGYRWMAAHRSCDHISCDPGERPLPNRRPRRRAVWRLARRSRWLGERQPRPGPGLSGGESLLEAALESVPGWLLLIVLPISVLVLRDRVAPWQFMWLMASAIFLG